MFLRASIRPISRPLFGSPGRQMGRLTAKANAQRNEDQLRAAASAPSQYWSDMFLQQLR
jgi:hypothetical protein